MADPAAACAQVVRASRSNFALSFRFLPRRQREAMHAVYAFCRRTDDIADGPGTPEEKRAALAAWRAELTDRGQDPVIRAVVLAAAEFDLDPRHLHMVIDGCAMDVEGRRIEGLSDLEDYCAHVAGAVGHLCLGVWGVRGEQADRLADDLGFAVQVTNILRDVGADARAGRLYIPRALLAQHGVEESEVFEGRRSDGLRAALGELAGLAHRAYERADLRHFRGPARRRLWPVAIIAGIYRRLLREIEALDFPLAFRVTLGRTRKALIVGRALVGRLLP